MGRYLALGLGVVMTLVGFWWTAQGLGWIEGRSMSGVEFWAKVGPALAGLGVALTYVAVRGVKQ